MFPSVEINNIIWPSSFPDPNSKARVIGVRHTRTWEMQQALFYAVKFHVRTNHSWSKVSSNTIPDARPPDLWHAARTRINTPRQKHDLKQLIGYCRLLQCRHTAANCKFSQLFKLWTKTYMYNIVCLRLPSVNSAVIQILRSFIIFDLVLPPNELLLLSENCHYLLDDLL